MRQCPWCGSNLEFSKIGIRRGDMKWHGIPLMPKNTLLCPNCGKAIRTSFNQWLYLPQLPLLYYLYSSLSYEQSSQVSTGRRFFTIELLDWFGMLHWWDWFLLVIGLICLVAQQVKSKYEKNE